MKTKTDTIVAKATPQGFGGVGVVRISGPETSIIAEKILGVLPKPRYATLLNFKDEKGFSIDQGIALYFPNPHSFTGEDVLELQGHGGPIVMDELLQRTIDLGARLAKPGEFSERAFLNGKIDLLQAEAVADLIHASSHAAVKSAMRSLQGEFSRAVYELKEKLINLQMLIESQIDFSEEEIDPAEQSFFYQSLINLLKQIKKIKETVTQGVMLRDGVCLVIVGKPNVGKSSLLNYLSGEETAIVADQMGTTRDLIQTTILIDGFPVRVIDTAGLRESKDKVEQEGISRAKRAIQQADVLLLMVDVLNPSFDELTREINNLFEGNEMPPIIRIKNKIDLISSTPQIEEKNNTHAMISISIKEKKGTDDLRKILKKKLGILSHEETNWIARKRHLEAIEELYTHLSTVCLNSKKHLAEELLAEDIRIAQTIIGRITGEFTTSDLLSKIFSEHCIGK